MLCHLGSVGILSPIMLVAAFWALATPSTATAAYTASTANTVSVIWEKTNKNENREKKRNGKQRGTTALNECLIIGEKRLCRVQFVGKYLWCEDTAKNRFNKSLASVGHHRRIRKTTASQVLNNKLNTTLMSVCRLSYGRKMLMKHKAWETEETVLDQVVNQ